LSSAVFEDAGDEPFKVGIGDAEVENSGFVVTEIILRNDNRRIEELKQLQADAVGSKHVRLMGSAKPRSENLPDFRHIRPMP
jgi:hypothetical protein